MDKQILSIYFDEDNLVKVKVADEKEAVTAAAEIVWNSLLKQDTKPLNALFAIVMHVLARELSGRLQKDFIRNLEEAIPEYREHYRKMREEIVSKERKSRTN